MIRKIFVYTMFMTLLSSSIESAEKISTIHTTTQTSVIFNTLCAKCHEGECSGRLSFNTGSKTATRHIAHYSQESNLTKTETDAFFSLLNYMKKRCAIYMPDDGSWKPKDLSRFALPSHKGYFIPLGTLKKGHYRLTIEIKEAIPFRLELLSDKIDDLFHQTVSTQQKRYTFDFSIEETVIAFIRIRSSKAFHVVSLKLSSI